jgi:transcriptional regulator with XRE-family HTH domain
MINDNFFVQLGINIKKYRNLQNLTQQELADKVGITLNHLGKIEVAYSRPSLDTIIDIANALNITVSELCKPD